MRNSLINSETIYKNELMSKTIDKKNAIKHSSNLEKMTVFVVLKKLLNALPISLEFNTFFSNIRVLK